MKILFVEDEDIFYPLLEMLSKKLSFELYIAKSVSEALKLLKEISVDLVVIDYELPDGKGDEINRFIKENFPNIKSAISSGHGETLKHAVNYDYTVDKSDFINFIKGLLSKQNGSGA